MCALPLPTDQPHASLKTRLGWVKRGHEATDTGLAYAPVSQAHGHHHSVHVQAANAQSKATWSGTELVCAAVQQGETMGQKGGGGLHDSRHRWSGVPHPRSKLVGTSLAWKHRNEQSRQQQSSIVRVARRQVGPTAGCCDPLETAGTQGTPSGPRWPDHRHARCLQCPRGYTHAKTPSTLSRTALPHAAAATGLD